jgi:chromosome segregation ATPase
MANGKGSEPATKAELKTEVQAVRTDLAAVRTELKVEIQAVRTDLASVRSEMKAEIQGVKATVDKLAVEVVKTQADVRDIRHTMATKMADKDDVSRILAAIDAFARKAVSYDQKSHSHGANNLNIR